MKAFTMEATIRFQDGKEEPFKASFSAPVHEAGRGYVCRFETSAFHGGSFHTPYPETSYAKAISHVRFHVHTYPWTLLNGRREVIEIQPPLVDEAGLPAFPVVSLQGDFHRSDGGLVPFWARIEPPVKNPDGTFGCLVSTSLHDISRSFDSEWPDHVYEMVFDLLRSLASHQEGVLRDRNGDPLVIAAIPRD